MFFSIPSSSEISVQKTNSTFESFRFYHVHLNGIHQWNLRYSQLFQFYRELERNFSSSMIDVHPFPGKKFFHLSRDEIEERRISLERFLQSIVRKKLLVSSNIFNGLFRRAQIETSIEERLIPPTLVPTSLSVFLLNQQENLFENLPIEIDFDEFLNKVFDRFQIGSINRNQFSLFFYRNVDDQLVLVRPLFPLELPAISLKQMEKVHQNCRIVFRKSSWNIENELRLFKDETTRRFISIQCNFNLETLQKYLPSEMNLRIDQLRQTNSEEELLKCGQSFHLYSCFFLPSCEISYFFDERQLNQKLPCTLAIGNFLLTCIFSGDKFDLTFKLTRIRCWRVISNDDEDYLTFEYLVKRDTMNWIRLYTDQAPLLSTCLQSMVDEILLQSNQIANSNDTSQNKPATCLTRRTKTDCERLNNNRLFDETQGDDDL